MVFRQMSYVSHEVSGHSRPGHGGAPPAPSLPDLHRADPVRLTGRQLQQHNMLDAMPSGPRQLVCEGEQP